MVGAVVEGGKVGASVGGNIGLDEGESVAHNSSAGWK
jgi:hypothetical protein